MKEEFLDLLACPETGQVLSLQVTERAANGTIKTGLLKTEDGTRQYRIRNGIPRFCDGGDYAESFAFEWAKFGSTQLESTNVDQKTSDSTRHSFVSQTRLTEDAIKGKTVVEFGCGPGRFLEIARSMGAMVVGLEITSAVDVAKANLGEDPDVFLVQGSVLHPPFRRDAFDCGFTIGVLHHTPAPPQGAKALVDAVKPGGHVAVSVYPEGGFYSFPSVYWMRKLVNTVETRIGARCARRLAMAYAYLSASIFYPVFRFVDRIPLVGKPLVGIWAYLFAVIIVAPGWRWRVLDTYDAITPTYASTHTPEEVEFWLRSAGCTEVKSTDVEFGYTGARPANFTGIKTPGTIT